MTKELVNTKQNNYVGYVGYMTDIFTLENR